MIRLYITPLVGAGTFVDPIRSKYKDTIFTPNGITIFTHRYGWRMVGLVAGDVDDVSHALLIANSDVYAFPDNFQTSGATVGAASTTLINILESYGIPAQWIQPQDTYLSVGHSVGAMFQFTQRMRGILGATDPFAPPVTLNTQFRNFSQAVQDAIMQVGAENSYNMSGINNNTTLRNLTKYMADQWGARPLLIGIFTF